LRRLQALREKKSPRNAFAGIFSFIKSFHSLNLNLAAHHFRLGQHTAEQAERHVGVSVVDDHGKRQRHHPIEGCEAHLSDKFRLHAAVGHDHDLHAVIHRNLAVVGIPPDNVAQRLANGAQGIDYVIHIGKIKEGDVAYIRDEMEQIVGLCRQKGVVSKVIFENCYLTEEEKIALCEIANAVRPDFIKTSTGFGPSSATVEDVALMRKHADPAIRVKAAGGIRDLKTCLSMIEAGGRVTVVPVTAKKLDAIGAVLEALNFYSWRDVVPAYYEVALKQKYSRDEISSQMFDLVLDSIYYDLGMTMLCETVKDGIYVPLFRNNERTLASKIETQLPKVNDVIDKAMNAGK